MVVEHLSVVKPVYWLPASLWATSSKSAPAALTPYAATTDDAQWPWSARRDLAATCRLKRPDASLDFSCLRERRTCGPRTASGVRVPDRLGPVIVRRVTAHSTFVSMMALPPGSVGVR